MHRLQSEHWILVGVAAAAAALFSTLGLWQAERHRARQARNDTLRSRLSAPALDGSGRPLDADSLAWRRVRLKGRYDFRREIVLRGRAHEGTPGIYVVTPLRRGDGPAVLVVRGWLPAADGVRAPLSRGRPEAGADSIAAVRAVLLSSVSDQPARIGRDTVDGSPHLVASHVNVAALADSLPYPVSRLYAQRVTPEAGRRGAGLPAALSAPSPDPGPHFWYAVQWFGFAVVAAGGTAAYLWSDLRDAPDAGPTDPVVNPGRAAPGSGP